MDPGLDLALRRERHAPCAARVRREAWSVLARALTVGKAINAVGMPVILIAALLERRALLG
ncbi:hypothetical protein [Falsiroseomonas sp.]|uniref:hypothetical protein n=1 Tax=Falsiroseomonas sp. TaxID=2870721 RepID=UPI0035659DD3